MRRHLPLFAAVIGLLMTALPAPAQELDTEDKKTLYALGLALSQRLSGFDLTAEELAVIEAGLSDGVLGHDAKVELQEYGPKIDGMLRQRAEAVAAREKSAAADFVEKAAAREGAVRTDSGSVYIETQAGNGASPAITDKVRLHYHGTLRDGTVFDSSVKAGEPAEFVLGQVIQCFSEGIMRMKVGGKATLICPPEAAYGDRGAPPMIPPGAAISFEVELLDILPGEAPAAAPDGQ